MTAVNFYSSDAESSHYIISGVMLVVTRNGFEPTTNLGLDCL